MHILIVSLAPLTRASSLPVTYYSIVPVIVERVLQITQMSASIILAALVPSTHIDFVNRDRTATM